jgi:dTDP-4-dehydrorhamnose 3,5-epimerase
MADPELGIAWPITLDEATVNDRDRNHPLLKDAKRFES